MTQSTLEQLQAIDPHVLTEIVRRDQQSTTFIIDDWQFAPLSSGGIMNPEGLFLFQGTGHDSRGSRRWSVVLKIIRTSGEEYDQRSMWYWKRELLAAQSQLLDRLPGPVQAPRIYATTEYSDRGWIWMEHIVPSSDQPWAANEYRLAARSLGRMHGAYLTGVPLPDEPWLCTEHCRWWLTRTARIDPVRAWDNPFVRAAFPEAMRARVEQLRAEQERFLAVLSHLPQVVSHFDFQRRNLLIRSRADKTEEVVAVDWALVGRGPVGGELCELVAGSALMCELEAGDVPELEQLSAEAYLAGLREAGWTGDGDLVRLGYCAWLAMQIGVVAPMLTVAWTGDGSGEAIRQAFGREPEAAVAQWAKLCELGLDRADEARCLMDRLSIG